MERVVRILHRFRFLWLGLVIAMSLIFAFLIKVEMDNSLRAWFSPDDPEYARYKNYRDTFGGGGFLIVALRSEGVFTREVLRFVKDKTEEFEDLPEVERVYSLANANKVTLAPEGIAASPLLYGLEETDLLRIKNSALEDEMFKDYLVSSDGQFTAIYIAFPDMPSGEIDRVVFQVKKMTNEGKPEGVEVFFSGDMAMMSELNKYSKENQSLMPILVVIMIAIFTFILFRSLTRVGLVLLVMGLSLIWTLGFYSVLGYTFNVVDGMLMPLVMILSVVTSIHIIEYSDEIRKSTAGKEVHINTLRYITMPCLITSVTTAFGLLSLAVSPIGAVKHFGIGSAAGIMFAFIISIAIVPLLMSRIPPRREGKQYRGWERFLSGLSKVNQRGWKYILVAAVIGFVFFGWGITRVRIETNQAEWFPKNGDFYKSLMIVDKNLSGLGDMEILIKGKKDALKEPDILRKMDSLSSRIEKLPHVKKVISLADYVKRINKALNEDNPEHYKIPESKALVAQELFLFSLSDGGREELERMATRDFSEGRISVKTESMPSYESRALATSLATMANEVFQPPKAEATLTGLLYLWDLMDKYILESQIKGFSLAFLLVIGVLFIAFWSAKYGGLSVIPNLLPITFILGIMGWAGFSLDTGTVMVSSVALGIVVDDTVHFISRFRKELHSREPSLETALRKTTVSVGRAIIFTSVINIAGFLIILISGFKPTREFGMLVALTLFFALIGDMLVLPSVMMATRKSLMRKAER